MNDDWLLLLITIITHNTESGDVEREHMFTYYSVYIHVYIQFFIYMYIYSKYICIYTYIWYIYILFIATYMYVHALVCLLV